MKHTSPITSVDISASLVVSGSYDGSVIGWHRDGTAVWRFRALDLINDVKVSPSGSHVAVAAADTYLYVLDVETGGVLSRCGPHADDVNAVAWHPDEVHIACVTDALGVDVSIWEWLRANPVGQFAGHGHGVFAVEYSPDGSHLVSAGEDGTARVWSNEGRQVSVLPHPGDPETATWIDSSSVATGCEDGVVRAWDIEGRLLRERTVSKAAVRLVRASADRSHLLVGCYDGTLRVLDPELQQFEALRAPLQWERSAAMATDGTVCVGSFGDRPIVYRRAGGLNGAPAPTYGVNFVEALSPTRCLASLDSGEVVEVTTGEVVATHETIVNATAIQRANDRGESGPVAVFSGDYHGVIRKTAPGADGTWREAGSARLNAGPVNTLAVLGDLLIAGDYSGSVTVLSSSDLRVLKSFEAHDGPIKSLVVSGGRIISGSADGSLAAHSVDGVRHFHSTAEDVVLINSVAVAAESSEIFTASREGRIAIWDLESGLHKHTLGGLHLKSAKCISAASDGLAFVTASYDGAAILWKRRDDSWVQHPLRLHQMPGVPACQLTAAGIWLGGWDGKVSFWSLSGELLHVYDPTSHIEGEQRNAS